MADQVVVRETLSITQQNVTEEDKEIGREFNKVLRRALAQAEIYLKYGPEDARLAVTKQFVTSAARLSTLDRNSEMEEHRTAFMSTIQKMAKIDESTPLVTATDIIDSITHDPLPAALTRRTQDQDNLPPA